MKSQSGRYLTGGVGTILFYVGGVWLCTEIFGLPVRPSNAALYTAATLIAFALNYKWVFASESHAGRSLVLFGLLQLFGVALNIVWVEGGLRLTPLYPWIIAASFFIFWPFISFTLQKNYIFNR